MVYNVLNYKELENLTFHDYRLNDIYIDYNNKMLTVFISVEEQETKQIKIKFYFASIECLEPWGEGIYINSQTISTKKLNENIDTIFIEFLLNQN